MLESLQIPIPKERNPIPATEEDFKNADCIIAVKKSEHLKFIELDFPQYIDKVEFWDIHDIDCARPEESLPVLYDKVKTLINIIKEKKP